VAIRLGVDVGGTNLRLALVDTATGTVTASRRGRHADRSPEAVAAAAGRLARELAAGAGLPSPPPAGLGVAGQCRGASGLVLSAPNLGWRDVPFGEMAARALGAPVRVANDLSAAALGEQRFGAARGVEDAVLFFVGSGVGAGLILGGRLHEGAGGVAGEVGHVKVAAPGGLPERRCGCGALGCLESWTGGAALAARAREAVAAGRSEALRTLSGGDPARVDAGLVEKACAGGDPYSRRLWEEVGALLGDAVANLAVVLDPARVVLGGGVLAVAPTLRRLLTERATVRALPAAALDLQLVPAELGDDAGVVGAALLAP
jgi:glucokinase